MELDTIQKTGDKTEGFLFWYTYPSIIWLQICNTANERQLARLNRLIQMRREVEFRLIKELMSYTDIPDPSHHGSLE